MAFKNQAANAARPGGKQCFTMVSPHIIPSKSWVSFPGGHTLGYNGPPPQRTCLVLGLPQRGMGERVGDWASGKF